jgi:hypothetical protein
MAFRLRQDTEDWFSQISKQKPIEFKFDLYYFCLMLGLASGRSSPPSSRCNMISEGFVDNFVIAYRPYQRLIVGLLLTAELSSLGVSINESDYVRKKLLELVDPVAPTNLTELGMTKLNEYVSGGFDYLTEHIDAKPYHVEEFLQTYVKLLRIAASEGPTWNQPAATASQKEVPE